MLKMLAGSGWVVETDYNLSLQKDIVTKKKGASHYNTNLGIKAQATQAKAAFLLHLARTPMRTSVSAKNGTGMPVLYKRI